MTTMRAKDPRSRVHRRKIPILTGCLLIALLVMTSCSSGTAPEPPAAASPSSVPVPAKSGWPSVIAAIGHSGLTGYDSGESGGDTVANSWATGENPDVDSVYLRILAENPEIEGNAINVAVDGSNVNDLIRQANNISKLTPQPQLVIVQSIDNDITCDGTDKEHLPVYRAGLVKVMDTLTTGLPEARVFFVSQWATVAMYDAVVMSIDPGHLAGTGPCDTVDPSTLKIVPANEATLQSIVDQYFATVVDVCSAYVNCETDQNAMQSFDLAADDLSPDLDHLSISGHAKEAAIAWDVLYPGK